MPLFLDDPFQPVLATDDLTTRIAVKRMFDDFTFDQRATAGSRPEFDPQFSPRDVSADNRSSLFAPAIAGADRDYGRQSTTCEAIDGLVATMSRQHLTPSRPEMQPRLTKKQTSASISIRDLNGYMVPQELLGPAPPITPPASIPPCVQDDACDWRSGSVPLMYGRADGSVLTAPQLASRRLRRQLDTRWLNSPASNRAIQSRIEHMIADGVQCNVKTSAPPSPSSTTRSTFSSVTPPLEPVASGDDTMIDMSMLEVDENHCEEDDKHLGEVLQYRRANMDAGIRKAVCYKVRSSAEAAAQCKKTKRSVLRMRRRPKSEHQLHEPATTRSY